MNLVEKVARALCEEYLDGADDSFAAAVTIPGMYKDPRKRRGYTARKHKFIELNYKSYVSKATKLLGGEQ